MQGRQMHGLQGSAQRALLLLGTQARATHLCQARLEEALAVGALRGGARLDGVHRVTVPKQECRLAASRHHLTRAWLW